MTKWPTAQSGGVSRTGPERGLLTEGPRGPWSCSRAWRACTAQGPRGGHGDPSSPHTCCSQIQSPDQTRMPASPHSPPPSCRPPGSLRQREGPPAGTLSHPTWGHRWAKASGICSCRSRGLSRPAPGFRVKKEEVVPEPQPCRGKAVLPAEGGARVAPPLLHGG